MNRHLKKLGILSIVGVILALGLYGESDAFPRGVDWRQVQTEHFTIVFLEQHRELIDDVAAMAESIHREMTRFLRYDKRKRVYVVVTDHIDSLDRMSIPVSRDSSRSRIVLLLNEPLSSASSFGLPSQQWLSLQFIYQYTFVMRHRMDRTTRTILSAVFPDSGFSGWMDGGMSLYMAMKLGGRFPHTSYLDMLMRTELLEDDFHFLSGQSAAGSQNWPGDVGLFLYGYSFLSYLSERYGAERLAELNHAQNRSFPAPFSPDKTFEELYGKTLKELQQDWYNGLTLYYGEQINTIREQPVTTMRPLSASGYLTGYPEFSPDGQFVYYIEDGPHHENALIQLRLRDNRRIRLAEGNFSGKLSVSSDGKRLFFSKTDYFKLYYYLSDLYVLDIAERKVNRLTHGERAFDPAIAPDGQTLVYIANQAGSTMLKKLELDSGRKTVLFEHPDSTIKIYSPSFSSDGKTIAFQMSTLNGSGESIYLLNLEDMQLSALPDDDALDSGPCWGPGDEYLLFASDRNGAPNIFAYVFGQQRLYQVTNAMSGVFHPSLSAAANSIALERYSTKGFDIHLMELKPGDWIPLDVQPVEKPLELKDYSPTAASQERGYNSFRPLLSWPLILPSLGSDEQGYQLGLYLSGSDILKQHEYSLLSLYGLSSGRLKLDGEYRYNRFRTKIGLFGYDRTRKYAQYYAADDKDDRAYWERQQGGGVTLGFPLYKSRKTDLIATTEYEYREMTERTEEKAEKEGPDPASGALSNVAARLVFQRVNRYRYSISPESGLYTSLEYKHYDEALGGDYNIDTVTGDAWLLLDSFWRHHVLALRGAGGYADGDPLEQGIFQLGGFFFDVESDVLSRTKFFFRGYGDRTFRGDRFLLGSAEYRLPFWQIEHSTLGGLLYWNSISGTLFFDSGHAWDHESEDLELQYSAGAEIGLNVGYWYGRVPVRCDIGVAHGFDEDLGETQIYFQMRVNTFSY